MRAPQKKLLICLTLLVLGVTMVWYGIADAQKFGEDWFRTSILLIGSILVPLSAVQSLLALLHSIGRLRLLEGHNVLARWHVPADTWRRSQALEPERTAQSGLPDDILISSQLVDRGVKVIVGKKSLLVGDSYHPLRRFAIPELYGIRLLEDSDPGCLEFHILYPRKNSPGVRMALRVPFTAESRSQAERIYDHFASQYVARESLAVRRPRRTIAVSLGVAALGATAAAWGYDEAYRGNASEVAPLIAAVVGTIVAPVGLIFALVTLLLVRRREHPTQP